MIFISFIYKNKIEEFTLGVKLWTKSAAAL